MYVFDPARPDDGVDLELPGTTMEGDVHSDLVSVWHLVKRLGFTCRFAPTGFEGFTKTNADGSTVRLSRACTRSPERVSVSCAHT